MERLADALTAINWSSVRSLANACRWLVVQVAPEIQAFSSGTMWSM